MLLCGGDNLTRSCYLPGSNLQINNSCNLELSCRVRDYRRALVLLGGRRLLLHVGRTNDIVDYLLVNVYGLLNRLRCRYVLPRYDLTQLARAGALALGLCRCSFMSG